jgi:hypothetical protein
MVHHLLTVSVSVKGQHQFSLVALSVTRISRLATASNQHTGDLALALLGGENGDEVKPLGRYKLAVYLNAMVEKRLVVTLVLDCFFAASIYRLDRPDIRFL